MDKLDNMNFTFAYHFNGYYNGQYLKFAFHCHAQNQRRHGMTAPVVMPVVIVDAR